MSIWFRRYARSGDEFCFQSKGQLLILLGPLRSLELEESRSDLDLPNRKTFVYWLDNPRIEEGR